MQLFDTFGAVAFDYGVNLMITPNEQRERAGLPPPTIVKNNDVPKTVKCPICGGNITRNDEKCKYCDTPLSWEEGE